MRHRWCQRRSGPARTRIRAVPAGRELEAPTTIRWKEISKNIVTATEGGYDLASAGTGTRVTIFNTLQGHGIGKLLEGFALRGARKDADAFAARIKAAVEAS